MTYSNILALLDSEIEKLQQARDILADFKPAAQQPVSHDSAPSESQSTTPVKKQHGRRLQAAVYAPEVLTEMVETLAKILPVAHNEPDSESATPVLPATESARCTRLVESGSDQGGSGTAPHAI